MTPILQAASLTKRYGAGENAVLALDAVDLSIHEGERIAIMGASGSGKTTLMNLLGLLDRPTSGRLLVRGEDASSLSDDALAALRSRTLGFVFQRFHLLPGASARANVELPLTYARASDRRERAEAALARVGLADRTHHRPPELSGGQQQRVAIARALVNDPPVILADEPTGNLDSRTTAEILDLFEALNEEGRTVVLVTHEEEVAARCRRVVRFRDGRIVADE
jgi:ABC-type lipoprotein export system ATPase subunit